MSSDLTIASASRVGILQLSLPLPTLELDTSVCSADMQDATKYVTALILTYRASGVWPVWTDKCVCVCAVHRNVLAATAV